MNSIRFQDVEVDTGVLLTKGEESYRIVVGELLAEGADLYVIRSVEGATFLSTDGWKVSSL